MILKLDIPAGGEGEGLLSPLEILPLVIPIMTILFLYEIDAFFAGSSQTL